MRTVPWWLALALALVVGAGASAATFAATTYLTDPSAAPISADARKKAVEACDSWRCRNVPDAVQRAGEALALDERYRPLTKR
ncbi:hypothetical protein [Cryptosporangium phraense]|uniref:Uncharacterized protein n=1 Tax=Cryptosporangium phraense TaxID=2593070 RepID=A0A545ANG6_9ACTN|nr:hypothetical protein [Cryptosporangium phraense]TQS42857.1 hypothetical protein FL583_22675 [Cryptosporangium phraense]